MPSRALEHNRCCSRKAIAEGALVANHAARYFGRRVPPPRPRGPPSAKEGRRNPLKNAVQAFGDVSGPFGTGAEKCRFGEGKLAGCTGLEPVASGVTGRRYNQL